MAKLLSRNNTVFKEKCGCYDEYLNKDERWKDTTFRNPKVL